MGKIMTYFSLLTQLHVDIVKPVLVPDKDKSAPKAFLLPTAKDITLAEYDPSSSDAITAHHLSDYRRRKFSLTLLPSIVCIMDDMISTEGLVWKDDAAEGS